MPENSKEKNDFENDEKLKKFSDQVTTSKIANDAIITNTSQKQTLDQAQLKNNQDSISELQMKALSPSDTSYKELQSNRFEIFDSEEETFSNSELELKVLERQTKDPVLGVIQKLANFIRGLAKDSPQREELNELRKEQQTGRINQLASFGTVAKEEPVMPPPEMSITKEAAALQKNAQTSLPPSKIHMQVGNKVSKQFLTRVDNFSRQIPQTFQSALTSKGVTIVIYSDSSEVPPILANRHAAGHSREQLTKNLPMFFEPRSKSLVFIEKPALTPGEQNWQKKLKDVQTTFTNKGVQDFRISNRDAKTFRYAPLERNGWHELGHALDQEVLNKFTSSPEFDKAYMADLLSIAPAVRTKYAYFTKPENSNGTLDFSRPKKELFAELAADALSHSYQYEKLHHYFSKSFALIKTKLSTIK